VLTASIEAELKAPVHGLVPMRIEFRIANIGTRRVDLLRPAFLVQSFTVSSRERAEGPFRKTSQPS